MNESSNDTSYLEVFLKDDPVSCLTLKFIGLYYVFVYIFGIAANTTLLYIFFVANKITPLNVFIVALTITNLIGVFFELPMVIFSNFYCGWIFERIGCIFEAALVYFIGCFSIWLMVFISFERFYIVYQPVGVLSYLNYNFVFTAIGFCFVVALFWTTMPLFGWSYYSFEGAETSCGVELKDRSLNVVSYNLCMFLFVFVIPVVFILFSNIKLIYYVKKAGRNVKLPSSKSKSRDKEKTITKSILWLTFCFIGSWLPYALVVLYTAFISSDVEPMVLTLPAMFAKSSFLWPSVIYFYTNSDIKLNAFRFRQYFVARTVDDDNSSTI